MAYEPPPNRHAELNPENYKSVHPCALRDSVRETQGPNQPSQERQAIIYEPTPGHYYFSAIRR